MKKRSFSAFLGLVLILLLLPAPKAKAASAFIDNKHWKETTSTAVTQMFSADTPFVVMFYRSTCFNSNLRKVMVESWMKNYDLDVYGVDVDANSIPRWVWAKLPGNSVTLPVIAIAESASQYECFTAKDSMRRIQNTLQEHLGIYDTSEMDFSRLNTVTFQNYSSRTSTAQANYLPTLTQPDTTLISIAQEITASAATDYEKAKAIYDWVTANIFYDYGMAAGTHTRYTSAMDTYFSKHSVCEGYANLTAAFCHAVGLPCRVITGYAAGADSEGTVNAVWEVYEAYLEDGDLESFQNAIARYTNHAWNEVYVDGRWIILDTTWGSNNDYYPESGGMIYGVPTDEYFDPDLEFFSQSHLFFEDHSSDFRAATVSGGVHICGILEEAELASSQELFLAVYDTQGKMLSCTRPNLNGNVLSQTLSAPPGSFVRLFLMDGAFRPTAEVYQSRVP